MTTIKSISSLKIILSFFLIAIIVFFAIKWWPKNIMDPQTTIPPINQYIKRIKVEIDSLKKQPANVLCRNCDTNIKYRINDYYVKGFLGISYSPNGKEIKNSSNNDQWREILLKDLFSAYAPKFVEQAMHVFNGTEWEINDLHFIQYEVNILSSSSYLDQRGPVENSFRAIDTIISKYYEISKFISQCYGFSYSNNDLYSNFPDVSEKIERSRAYLANYIFIHYISKCSKLKNGLKDAPKILFDKHISYLQRKINDNGGRYKEFKIQPDFNNRIHDPLQREINSLNNTLYRIEEIDFYNGRRGLNTLLEKYNREATDYFLNINKK